MPACRHHARSSRERWAARWWPRQSGTANSSLTLRPSARGWVNPRWWGVRGLAAAHEARLLGDIAKVLAAAIATRGRDPEDALVDTLRLTGVGAFGGGKHLR